jgi:hypothetical protein
MPRTTKRRRGDWFYWPSAAAYWVLTMIYGSWYFEDKIPWTYFIISGAFAIPLLLALATWAYPEHRRQSGKDGTDGG